MKFRASCFLFSLVLLSTAAGCNRQSTSTNNNNATATPSNSATPDAFAAVRGIYAKDCQSCHGAEGNGGRVKLEDGTRLRVPSLREGHALRHPNSEFVKQITQGGDGMPAFKDKLNQQQVDEMISFIRSEFQGGMTPPPEKSSTSQH
jgi:mono/diheme cytochrome c family protein